MFKGLGQLGDIAGMMKQAKEMQAKAEQAQEDLKNLIVEGEAGGGMVRVSANGRGKVTGINIDESLFVAENKIAVEDLILAAVNDAQSKASERAKERMAEVTGGIPLPDGIKDLF